MAKLVHAPAWPSGVRNRRRLVQLPGLQWAWAAGHSRKLATIVSFLGTWSSKKNEDFIAMRKLTMEDGGFMLFIF